MQNKNNTFRLASAVCLVAKVVLCATCKNWKEVWSAILLFLNQIFDSRYVLCGDGIPPGKSAGSKYASKNDDVTGDRNVVIPP